VTRSSRSVTVEINFARTTETWTKQHASVNAKNHSKETLALRLIVLNHWTTLYAEQESIFMTTALNITACLATAKKPAGYAQLQPNKIISR